MAIKKIEITDTSKEPAPPAVTLTFDTDANGRLKLRGTPPRGMSMEMAETICTQVYIGVNRGQVGQFVWAL
jgi:hypothetical protein